MGTAIFRDLRGGVKFTIRGIRCNGRVFEPAELSEVEGHLVCVYGKDVYCIGRVYGLHGNVTSITIGEDDIYPEVIQSRLGRHRITVLNPEQIIKYPQEPYQLPLF